MNIVRVQNPDNASSVNVKAYARARIAPGVQYINDNTMAERAVRKVSFRVFCDGLAAGTYGPEATIYWTASKSKTDDTFRIYSTYTLGGLQTAIISAPTSSAPMLSVRCSCYWTCDENGYLVSPDGRYLALSGEEFSLASAPADAVRVYKLEGGELTQVSSISNGGAYLLLVPVGDGNYRMLKVAPEPD